MKIQHAIFGNLVLRILLWLNVCWNRGWRLGDTDYWLTTGQQVASGFIGGDGYRTPLYQWVIGAFTFLGGVPSLLLFQTSLVWTAGYLLFKKGHPFVALLFLFDPGILIYSNLVMSDAFFAPLVLLFGYYYLPKHAFNPWLLGLVGGIMALSRPLGFHMFIFAMVVSTVQSLSISHLKKSLLKRVIVASLLFNAIILPRVLWNHHHYGIASVVTEMDNSFKAVAGVVENHGLGLNFTQAEEKWHADHPGAPVSEAYKTIGTHLGVWGKLSLKGIARTLVGHLNIEGFSILTGKTIEGPGWFKETSVHYTFWAKVAWVLGLAFFGSYYLWLYWRVGYAWYCAQERLSPFLFWCAGSIAALAGTLQVFGDARFRLPIVSILCVLLIHFSNQAGQNGKRTRQKN